MEDLETMKEEGERRSGRSIRLKATPHSLQPLVNVYVSVSEIK